MDFHVHQETRRKANIKQTLSWPCQWLSKHGGIWWICQGGLFGILNTDEDSDHWQLTNRSLIAKVCRLLGKVKPSRFCLKSRPNLKLCRLHGNVTPFKLWLNFWPNSRSSKALGKVTASRFWLNLSPNLKLRRLLGKVTFSKFWLKETPNVRDCKLPGKMTPRRFWLKL